MAISSRLLRKYQEDDLKRVAAKEDNSDPDEIPFSIAKPKKNRNLNRYDVLNNGSQSESEVKEDDNNELDSSGQINGEAYQHNSRASTKRKKKRKKRKSLSASSAVHKHSSEDIDDVERSVREVNAILGVSYANTSGRPQNTGEKVSASFVSGILAIEKKHLNPKNELRRMFGSKTVQNAQEGKMNRGRNRGHFKNLWLVSYRERWSTFRNGLNLSMVPAEKKEGCQYFNFVHGPDYQLAEKKFLQSVESIDPDELMLMVNMYPLHVNTLIQMSEMCKMSEEFSMAASLIERALFALESAFHLSFNLGKGNCRLDYNRQENRALFIVIFSHLTFVGQRACYRTALEFCKLLLSLSPDVDPLAIILAMDFYAIRAKEYSWLLKLIEETDARRHLTQLPNMAFGRAIATFLLNDKEKADELLQDALIMFPGVLLPLLDKCSIAPDPKTTACAYFRDASLSQSPYLTQLLELYVGRSYHLWKSPDLMRWLESNTLAVIDLVAKKDIRVADYTIKRAKRYFGRTPLPVSRHILLSDIKGVPMYEEGTTFNFDPLPPPDSVNLYERPARPQILDRFNVMSLFFRSLMPNFNAEQPDMEPPDNDHRGNNDGEAAAVEGAEGREGSSSSVSLHRSVTTLLDAMRDLMENLQLPRGGSGESTNSDNDDSESDYDSF